jgi:hypothetical protein
MFFPVPPMRPFMSAKQRDLSNLLGFELSLLNMVTATGLTVPEAGANPRAEVEALRRLVEKVNSFTPVQVRQTT